MDDPLPTGAAGTEEIYGAFARKQNNDRPLAYCGYCSSTKKQTNPSRALLQLRRPRSAHWVSVRVLSGGGRVTDNETVEQRWRRLSWRLWSASQTNWATKALYRIVVGDPPVLPTKTSLYINGEPATGGQVILDGDKLTVRFTATQASNEIVVKREFEVE